MRASSITSERIEERRGRERIVWVWMREVVGDVGEEGEEEVREGSQVRWMRRVRVRLGMSSEARRSAWRGPWNAAI